jgi:muramoyltetrapeptide carboxypeptidase
MDRMFAQLKLSGILSQVSGVVFGKCTKCDPDSGGGYGSLTLEEVLDEYIKPLNVPAYSGAMIGHIADKFTIPVGLNAEIDATKGTIQLLESAVS